MLIDSGYRQRGSVTPLAGPTPRPSRPRPPVTYELVGLVLSADPGRGEVLVDVEDGLRAEPFVGRCIRARLDCDRGALQDRGGRCSLLLDHLHVGDRVEIRACLPADLGPRPPSTVPARQVILLDPRCARQAA